jgi:hypothetical protein
MLLWASNDASPRAAAAAIRALGEVAPAPRRLVGHLLERALAPRRLRAVSGRFA